MLAAEITNEVFRLHPDSLIHGKTKGGKVLLPKLLKGPLLAKQNSLDVF